MGQFGLLLAAGVVLHLAATPAVAASPSGNPETRLDCPPGPGDPLVYIDIYDGPPEQQADLVPDQHSNPASMTAWNIWALEAGPAHLYVKCGYGKRLEGPYSRTEVITLPDTVKNCRADFKTGPAKNQLTLQRFSCR